MLLWRFNILPLRESNVFAILSDRSPEENMLGVVERVSRDPLHQRLPATGAADVVKLNEEEEAMVLLL